MNSNHYTPIFTADRYTFCTLFFQACLKKGNVSPEAQDLFVRDCAKRFPIIIDEFIEIGGTTYGWEFNGDYKITAEYKIQPTRNFTVWKRAGTTAGMHAGQETLQKVTNDLADDKCDRFGGTPGMRLIEEAELPPQPEGLLRESLDQDVGFWGRISWGVSAVFGIMILYFTRGAPLSAPATQSFTPSLTPLFSRDNEA